MKKFLMLFLTIALGFHGAQPAEQNDYSFKLLTGKELQDIALFMIQQRIEIMRDYPYLYQGDMNEEIIYMQQFISLPHAAAAVAYLHDQPVGFVSGTSFLDYESDMRGSSALFMEHGLDPKDFYYIPEAMIMAEHRRKSLFKSLHHLIELHAQSLGYKALCLLSENHDQHPLKPIDYRGPDGAFTRAGYSKTDMIMVISPDVFVWPTIQPDGSIKIQTHFLAYWIKIF
ncbi:MAG TPA: hypothetical protein VGT41_02655 [Candidatus Babeliales bacterium]|nr:hypothetical protein [Candidatus Babeliales bacterium]